MSQKVPDSLSDIHSLLTAQFRAILEEKNPSAAQLNTIRQFLKDNDVTVLQMLSEQGGIAAPLHRLSESMPFTDPEDGPVLEERTG